jgi:hypothetical protein
MLPVFAFKFITFAQEIKWKKWKTNSKRKEDFYGQGGSWLWGNDPIS